MFAGILVNLEGSKLMTARADLVVPIVTSIAEVLAVDVAAMLVSSKTEPSKMEADKMEMSETQQPSASSSTDNTEVLGDQICLPVLVKISHFLQRLLCK